MKEVVVEALRVVGKGIPRADARLKACGVAHFAADIRQPQRRLLFGKILRSPHAHAAIISIDTSQAAALPGVYAVVTAEDATPARIGRFLRDRTVLARGKVRCVGEPVAAVAAIDEATAEEALSLIEMEYRQLPSVFTTDQALAPGAPNIHEDLASYEDPQHSQRVGNQRNLVVIEHGGVDAAFAMADVVVEGVFTTQPVHQGFIESKACVASVDHDGKVTVWASTKSPFLNRTMIARGLGLPLSRVRVITPAVGGDFGGKGAPTIEPICALLAIKAGRPVRIALSTQEELATNFVRHPSVVKLKAAADRDGRLLGVQGEITFNCGAYCDGVEGIANKCCNLQGPYNVPAVRLQGHSVYTNSAPAGHFRAPGGPQTNFGIECLLDEIARRLNADPIAIRRINVLQEGDPGPGGKGTMGGAGLRETVDRIDEYVAAQMSERKPNRGIGVACGSWHVWLSHDVSPTKCIVKLNEDGSAALLTGLPDNGAGQYVVLSQIVGEVLGLDPEEVAVAGGDTDLAPYDIGPGGSRGTTRVGNAAKFAAEDARRQILGLAASKLEAKPEDLEIENRQVFVKGTPRRTISLASVAREALTSPEGAIIGTGSSERAEWLAREHEHGAVVDEGMVCTHAAQVEVDPETGQVTVLKYVVAQDVGRALNRLSAVGQIHGAVAAGLGYALTEEIVVREGRVLNPFYVDYHLPAADITPDVHAILIERPSALGPFGARGIGEVSTTPVAAAIANAVYDAVGVRIRDLPITPEKVLRALKERSSSAQGL
ncbi:MAG: xanthine dehydrogenase family protein molybdopterin-binding subunit [Chloroflexi bacterium]|nr:xanthine dehydrogenase family protein molybdopterin-binding subunit [Chloroflexota bacterium]